MATTTADALSLLLPEGRGVWVPMDHGLTSYPVKGLEDYNSVVDECIDAGADAIVLHKGFLSYQTSRAPWPKFVMHTSASTIHAGLDSDNKIAIANAEEAKKRGAAALSFQINLGDPSESRMINSGGNLTSAALDHNLPVLGMVYPRGPNLTPIDNDMTNGTAHAARLAWEIGCHVAKVPWTGSQVSFNQVCSAVPIPVLIAGGSNDKPFQEILEIVEKSIEAGGAGVCMGRQIFSKPNRSDRIRALRAVVHEGKNASQAMEMMR